MSAEADAGIVIIGAGETGGRTALTLRERGYGGGITLVGNEVHPPYERPPLSKDALVLEEDHFPRTIASAADLATADIRFLPLVDALAIDRGARTVALSNGSALAYGRLLLATGASPRRLTLDLPEERCAYLRTHDDARRLRARLRPGCRLAVIGGGFIGLEIAASARLLGCDVTLIEGQPRILMRGVPADIAETVHREHVRQGVRVHCGRGIDAVRESGGRAEFVLNDGTVLAADLVVVGIGASPNVALAEAAGLAIDNGIAVDGRLRTSDPAIFAAGDCASFPIPVYGGRRIRLESWRNAQEQALVAAENLMGGETTLDTVPWFWSDQYDLGLQVAGLADEARTTIRRDLGDGAFILFGLDDDGRLVTASGIGPGNAVARDIRIAEMLIARRARPDPAALAEPQTKLKALLAA